MKKEKRKHPHEKDRGGFNRPPLLPAIPTILHRPPPFNPSSTISVLLDKLDPPHNSEDSTRAYHVPF